jgi:pantetheine-phosphate adenylyltransferase
MAKAMFALSGDPIHNGHINTIERISKLFYHVHIGIGVNETKKYLFNLNERLDLIRKSTSHIKNITVSAFDGLLVDYALLNGIEVIVKSVRNQEDCQYEKNLYSVGKSQVPGIETLIMFSDPRYENVSSSVIKALEQHKGFIHEFVPLCVKQALEKRISGQVIIGITGGIGCGKSYITKKLIDIMPMKVINIDFDNLVHEIYTQRLEPYYNQVRRNIAAEFGDDIVIPTQNHNISGMCLIDSHILAGKVFPNPEAMHKLYTLLDESLFILYREKLQKHKDCIIFLNCAYLLGNKISDFNLSHLCNNNIILIECGSSEQYRRLKTRSLTDAQITDRINSQFTNGEIRKRIQDQIKKDNYGKMVSFDNRDGLSEFDQKSIKNLAEIIRLEWW